MFDGQTDPYQWKNLCNDPQVAGVQRQLEQVRQRQLRETGDDFQPGEVYLKKSNYVTGKDGTMPYTN